jgi:hypothetical protein
MCKVCMILPENSVLLLQCTTCGFTGMQHLLHGCPPRSEEGLLSKIRWEVKVRLITKFLFKVVCPLGSSLFVVVVVFLVLCR